MENIIIHSATCQEFLKERYYKCGFYFQRNGKRLHREVWKYFFGKIPERMHIHHKNGDKANNWIENLEMLPIGHHLSLHWQKNKLPPPGEKAHKRAAEWHKSAEGRAWHREHWKKTGQKKLEKIHTKKCLVCQDVFSVNTINCSVAKYCSSSCKERARPTRSQKRGKK